MDLSNLNVIEKANDGAILKLTYPADVIEKITDDEEKTHYKGDVIKDENGNDFYIALLGTDSDVYRKAQKRNLEKRLNAKQDKKVDLDDAQLKGAQLIAKCTTDCFFIENGEPVKCTFAEMTRIYLAYPWVREQAESFMAERTNFIKS